MSQSGQCRSAENRDGVPPSRLRQIVHGHPALAVLQGRLEVLDDARPVLLRDGDPVLDHLEHRAITERMRV